MGEEKCIPGFGLSTGPDAGAGHKLAIKMDSGEGTLRRCLVDNAFGELAARRSVRVNKNSEEELIPGLGMSTGFLRASALARAALDLARVSVSERCRARRARMQEEDCDEEEEKSSAGRVRVMGVLVAEEEECTGWEGRVLEPGLGMAQGLARSRRARARSRRASTGRDIVLRDRRLDSSGVEEETGTRVKDLSEDIVCVYVYRVRGCESRWVREERAGRRGYIYSAERSG